MCFVLKHHSIVAVFEPIAQAVLVKVYPLADQCKVDKCVIFVHFVLYPIEYSLMGLNLILKVLDLFKRR